MGLFAPPRSPKNPSSLESARVATLGGVQVSLTLLEKLLDGTSIPFAKGAVGTALEVIKLAEAIQSDREDCDILVKRTTSLLIVILDSLKGKTEQEIPSHLRQSIERLATNFQEVLAELRIIDKRIGKKSTGSIARSILYHFDNTEKLTRCSAKLEWAINEFQVISKVDSCLKDLERHQQLSKELREGHAKIQDGQTRIEEKLAGIQEAVMDKTHSSAPIDLPSTVMPASPRVFGRQSYIDKAVLLLLSSTSTRIVILGPGGMGKTSVALNAAHDPRVIERFGIYRRWVPCEQALSRPLFVELIAKSLGLPQSTSNDRFKEIVDALEKSDALQFVLFDNFETIWELEGEQAAVASILSRLASIPSLSIIITMRGIQHPASNLIDWTSPRLPPLTPLELDPAKEAFLRISPDSEGDAHLPELLRELDCMPLAITLMAKLAEVGESITELLSQWRQEQIKLLSQPGGDRTSSIEVSIRLSLTSSSVRSNADAIPLLSILARLPGGAFLERLPTICPSIQGWKASLRVLRTAALVYDSPDKTAVHILSPIRLYVLLHHPPAEGPLQDLRQAYYQLADKGNATIGDSNFLDVSMEFAAGAINLDAILVDALHNAGDKEDAIVAATGYSHHLNCTQPRVDVIETAVQLARRTGSSRLAVCLNRYGEALRYQSRYDAASLALEEARDMYLQVDDKYRAASCLWSMGDMSRVQNKYDEACSKLEEAKWLFMELNDIIAIAHCLCLLGVIYLGQGQYQVARSTVEAAKAQFVQLRQELGIASCLLALSEVYLAEGQYEAASSAAEDAISVYIKLRESSGIAHAVYLKSRIYYHQGQYPEAYSAAEEAKSRYVKRGDQAGYVDSLLSMGNALLKQGRYDEAHRCAEEGKNAYIKLGNSQGIADSHRLLGDIYLMQGEYGKAYSLLEEAKSLFSRQNPSIYTSSGLADCNSSLGKVSRLQAHYEDAIKLLEEARTTYSTIGYRKKDAEECAEEIVLAVKARDSGEEGV